MKETGIVSIKDKKLEVGMQGFLDKPVERWGEAYIYLHTYLRGERK